MKYILGLFFVALVTISTCQAQSADDTWVLLSSSNSGEQWVTNQSIPGFTAISSGTWPYLCTVYDYFTVAGDSTQSPPWDNLYETICNNRWSITCSGNCYLNSGQTLTFLHTYYTETGSETWLDTDTAYTASRSMSEQITDYLVYTISNPPSNGGGGGGGA